MKLTAAAWLAVANSSTHEASDGARSACNERCKAQTHECAWQGGKAGKQEGEVEGCAAQAPDQARAQQGLTRMSRARPGSIFRRSRFIKSAHRVGQEAPG